MKARLALAATLATACMQMQQPPPAVNPGAPTEPTCDERLAAAVEGTRREERSAVVEARQHAAADRRLLSRQLEDLWMADNALERVRALEEELGNLEAAVTLLKDQRLKPADLAEALSRLAARLLEVKQDVSRARGRASDALRAAERRYVDGHGMPSALIAGVNAYQEACDGGDLASCVRLGQAYEHGAGLAADPTWAVNLYSSACQGGDGYGCHRAGALQLDGAQNVRNTDKALAALQRGCELGQAEACARLALALERGEGVPADQPGAAQLLRKACLAQATEACVRLALKHQVGDGVSRDLAQSANLLQLGCESGDPFACSHLGEMYLTGNGVTVDRGRATELLQVGCAGGNAWACKLIDAPQ